ncbi:selenocysteine lyase, isoform CRA_b [Hyaloraphidium curvatum]|nr:selenocysteine lyase, isoform CRA_b [Hyaloraphidium curvatum]
MEYRGYFDYNATTAYLSEASMAVADAMREGWGNPSSTGHPFGRRSKELLEKARSQIARAVGAEAAHDVVFLSGGTEANNLVLENAVRLFEHRYGRGNLAAPKPHVVISAIEHPAIAVPAKELEFRGLIDLTVVGLRPGHGAAHPDDIAAALRPTTALVSIMLVNNETGAVADLRGIADRVRAWERAARRSFPKRTIVHTDAAQAIGKMRVDARELGVDMLTVVGHKFYAPRIGALYVRGLGARWDRGYSAAAEFEAEVPLFATVLGGGQEKGWRSGTENVPQCAGLGAAAEAITVRLAEIEAKNSQLIGLFEERVAASAPAGFRVVFHGKSNPWGRASNVSMFSVAGRNASLDNGTLAAKLVQAGFVVGKGAACHSDGTASGVLAAMQVEPALAKSALRFSVGLWSTREEVLAFVNAFWAVVAESSVQTRL